MNDIDRIETKLSNTPKMPALFLGHGSPMNALEENNFVRGFRQVAATIKTPKAILCISAHWETQGTRVTAMQHPRTIHDFGGFPPELYAIQYPAPGSPELAAKTKKLVSSAPIRPDEEWGLDHGAWTVIRHMYPDADIPIVQLSLDYTKNPMEHYTLAKELHRLRDKGVLIVGSGNIVHNLQLLSWNRLHENFAHDWAEEASRKMKKLILDGNHQELIQYTLQGKAVQMSIPTPEHFLPLLYILALQDKTDEITLFNDQPVGGALDMTSVKMSQLKTI